MFIIIAAVAKNGVIGKDGKLPWHIPAAEGEPRQSWQKELWREDMKRFKKLTEGKIVLMGRKTFESILGYLGKPLPNRKNIVITRQENYKAPEGVRIYPSVESALEVCKNEDICIIGGAEIYKQTLPLADKIFITEIHKEIEGDAFFPEINKSVWREVNREGHEGYSFVEYNKKNNQGS